MNKIQKLTFKHLIDRKDHNLLQPFNNSLNNSFFLKTNRINKSLLWNIFVVGIWNIKNIDILLFTIVDFFIFPNLSEFGSKQRSCRRHFFHYEGFGGKDRSASIDDPMQTKIGLK